MARFKDYSKQRFGRLVLRAFARRTGGETYWHADCDCGKSTVVAMKNISSGATRSCGCGIGIAAKARAKHRSCGTAAYSSWQAMWARCRRNKRYIARGITVCKRWLKFENFLADMGERPENCSLDRRKNNKGYSLGNCRWATIDEQNRNTTRSRMLTYRGRTMTAADWADELGIPGDTLRQRLYRGWPLERVLQEYERN